MNDDPDKIDPEFVPMILIAIVLLIVVVLGFADYLNDSGIALFDSWE